MRELRRDPITNDIVVLAKIDRRGLWIKLDFNVIKR